MSIQYTYEVVRVDEAARCMEVVYLANGHQKMHIGTRLPYAGETLETVIAQYAPIPHWEEQQRQVMLPAVGTSGTIAPMVAGALAQASTVSAIVTSLV